MEKYEPYTYKRQKLGQRNLDDRFSSPSIWSLQSNPRTLISITSDEQTKAKVIDKIARPRKDFYNTANLVTQNFNNLSTSQIAVYNGHFELQDSAEEWMEEKVENFLN